MNTVPLTVIRPYCYLYHTIRAQGYSVYGWYKVTCICQPTVHCTAMAIIWMVHSPSGQELVMCRKIEEGGDYLGTKVSKPFF